MPKRLFEQRFRDKLAEYEQAYDLSSINSANDRDNLRALITNSLLIEDLQQKLQDMSDSQDLDPASVEETTKLIQKLLATNQQLERQLGIDRKTRRASGSDSLPEYIASLQEAAKQFLEQRLVKVICPQCHVLVGRFAPVHNHTRYVIAFQCSQCKQMAVVERNERSVWFDLKPKEYRWRKNYPVSIRQTRSRRAKPVELPDVIDVSEETKEEIVVFDDRSVENADIVIDDGGVNNANLTKID